MLLCPLQRRRTWPRLSLGPPGGGVGKVREGGGMRVREEKKRERERERGGHNITIKVTFSAITIQKLL